MRLYNSLYLFSEVKNLPLLLLRLLSKYYLMCAYMLCVHAYMCMCMHAYVCVVCVCVCVCVCPSVICVCVLCFLFVFSVDEMSLSITSVVYLFSVYKWMRCLQVSH